MATEFPDLGANCAMLSCRQLDFLPMKCDACSKVFCASHITYDSHSCEPGRLRNRQVPVCPLCDRPIPGVQPDVIVGRHIDSDCKSDVAKKRIYKNRCNMPGCKVRELVPITCRECNLNYCMTHRHASDHNCDKMATQRQRQQVASVACRQQASHNSNQQMNEDEALARALQLSLQDSHPTMTQEECDAALAASLQIQEDERANHSPRSNQRNNRNCILS